MKVYLHFKSTSVTLLASRESFQVANIAKRQLVQHDTQVADAKHNPIICTPKDDLSGYWESFEKPELSQKHIVWLLSLQINHHPKSAVKAIMMTALVFGKQFVAFAAVSDTTLQQQMLHTGKVSSWAKASRASDPGPRDSPPCLCLILNKKNRALSEPFAAPEMREAGHEEKRMRNSRMWVHAIRSTVRCNSTCT